MDLQGNVRTLNQLGWSSLLPDEYASAFSDFSATCAEPVLDIGAGFGSATLAALAAGASVIANDLESRHLDSIAASAPEHLTSGRLTVLRGRFPELDLPDLSLGAANASRVLHFLTGAEIEEGVIRLHRWLVRGGKVFALAQTPWCANTTKCTELYESRLGIERWPGEIYGLHEKIDPQWIALYPDFLHMLDQDVLRRAFETAGFKVEKLEVFRRRDLPPEMYLDGRENIGIIARKL
jgi:SAM-dependent methyltransferase